ncbi:hypothetical protein RRG08_036194 [Elysia crispata]|uniref:Uncharacterized protein n=1 Tax=Elysia crispata TaxID=231223 RepID=A0AAE0XEC8_9GAST|nr:hypothetical protein RRG08_036194 [Elysia crispata]
MRQQWVSSVGGTVSVDTGTVGQPVWIQCPLNSQCATSVRSTVSGDPVSVGQSMWILGLWPIQCGSSFDCVGKSLWTYCRAICVVPASDNSFGSNVTVSANLCGPIVGRSVWHQLQIVRVDTLRTVRMDPVSVRPCRSSFRVCAHPVSDIEWTNCPTVRVYSM